MPTENEYLLIVDDDETNRDLLSKMLRRNGYRVATAEGGEQALTLIRQHPFDLVLLDNMMPGMSGIEVLEQLRAEFGLSQLPVIMVTAQNESANIVKALNLGANDYVTKPVDYPVISARIRNQLSRKMAEQALRDSEERYALAARGSNDGLWDWNLEEDQVYYSRRWKEILGYQDHEIHSSPSEWLDRVHPEDAEKVRADLAAHRAGQSPSFESEHRIRHKDGSHRWVLTRGAAVRDTGGKATRIAGSLTDITDAKIRDPLTSLPNRLYFLDVLERILERSRHDESAVFAVLFIDLDRFKVVNDSLGHLAGDRLLAEVGQRFRSAIRHSGDTITRFGGDEFAALVEKIEKAEDAERVADRILKTLAVPIALEGHRVFATASIGIALSTSGCRSPQDLLRNADTAMYHAKARGKNCFVVFDGAMRERAIARLQMESDLRLALERNEFVVHYQPKISLATGAVIGFEALVRWNHPKRGLVPPSEFIPLAEETGLIIPLGLQVLRMACAQMAEWQRDYPCDPPLVLSVNISGKQFSEPALLDQVSQVLRESGLDPGSLSLEITESVIMENAQSAREMLVKLKEMHLGLKMDDFGTGYSSLNCLHRFPFDTLKIDRSFIGRMDSDQESAEIVRTIISLAHALGMHVVAEGVESTEQSSMLHELGCEYGQGYLFAKPLDKDQTRKIIEKARMEGAAAVQIR